MVEEKYRYRTQRRKPDREVHAPVLIPSQPGRPHTISRIDPEQFKQALAAITAGATPYVALSALCGISPGNHYRWMRLGREPVDPLDPLDAMAANYYTAVHGAQMAARMNAESAVHAEDPLAWLRVGPAGRDRGAEEPGWIDQSQVRHTDELGEGPPRVLLEFTVSGVKTTIESKVSERIGGVIDVPKLPKPGGDTGSGSGST